MIAASTAVSFFGYHIPGDVLSVHLEYWSEVSYFLETILFLLWPIDSSSCGSNEAA